VNLYQNLQRQLPALLADQGNFLRFLLFADVLDQPNQMGWTFRRIAHHTHAAAHPNHAAASTKATFLQPALGPPFVAYFAHKPKVGGAIVGMSNRPRIEQEQFYGGIARGGVTAFQNKSSA